MSRVPLETAVRRIRSLTAPGTADLSDRDLLSRFRKTGDEPAFAALVARHGPAVLGVCRRVLADRHAAEDAFQATFLVLARRAGAIRQTASVGCWLHGVAFRVATRLKGRLARQPRAGAVPDVAAETRDDVSWREVRRVLDEEVTRLPERLRLPVLLCYFEGRTRDEAAEALGWKLTTLRGRLEDGRLRLRARLSRRGVELSAALLAASAAADGVAVEESLLVSTVRAATGSAPDPIQALAKGVAMSGLLGKGKLTAGALVLAVGLGTTLLAFRGQAGEAPGPNPPPKAPEAPPKKADPPPAPKADDAWGEPAGGVRARLRLAKTAFKAGEPLAFELDLKNTGDKTYEDGPIPFHCRIELDGAEYRYTAPLSYPTSIQKLTPGKEFVPYVRVTADRLWEYPPPGASSPFALVLTPGKHKVRVSYPVSSKDNVKPVSPPVEFEVAADEAVAPDLKTLVARADRIVVAKIDWEAGKPRLKQVRTLKGPAVDLPPAWLPLTVPLGTEPLPGTLDDVERLLFLKAEEDGVEVPKLSPAAARGWFRPATPEAERAVLGALPLPKERGAPEKGLTLALRPAAASVRVGGEVRLDVVLTSHAKGQARVLQQRYNVYDYWPFLTFTVTCPDGRVVTLRKLEGAFKREDYVAEFALKAGESYTHAVRLDRWPNALRGRVVGPIRPDPFREPGKYKVEATYRVPAGFKNIHPRLEFDEWPFWGGELKSNAVTIEVQPAVGAGPWIDFRKNADSLHLAVSIRTPDRFPLPPGVQLRYVYLDARPIPREPHGVDKDGRPIGADARITGREAQQLIDVLADGFRTADGFFDRAWEGEKAREITQGEFLVEAWHEGPSGARLKLAYPWTSENLRFLDRLAAALSGPGREPMQKLLAPVADAVPPWGEAVRGLQARVHMTTTQWPGGKAPKVELELRNRGNESWKYYDFPTGAEVEVDGAWYDRSLVPPFPVGGRTQEFKPGGRTDQPIRLTLDGEWTRPTPGGGVPGKQGVLEALELKPGKHTIRVAYRFEPTWGESVRVASPPVEIEVGDYLAGEPVRGVRARLRTSRERWTGFSPPRFDFEMMSESKNNYHHAATDRNCLIEVDGVWYENENGRDADSAHQSVLLAGSKWIKWFDVYADRPRGGGGSWVPLVPDDPIRPAPESQKLKLAPGRHTIRVSFFLYERRMDGKATDEFRVETNAVEFEVGK